MEIRLPILLDGATGTQLFKRGFHGGCTSEEWILNNTDVLTEVQRKYIEAGSKVIYTPTFGANRAKLSKVISKPDVRDYNLRLAELSLSAADGRAAVAGDIAPTGIFTRLKGQTTQELVDIYGEQAAALEEAGVDLFVVETMMTLSDLLSAVRAVREVGSKQLLVSCTCDGNGRMADGTDICEVPTLLGTERIIAFGLNCSMGPQQMLPQIKRLAQYTEMSLLAKPNAGIPKQVNGNTVYDSEPTEFAQTVKAMTEYGVRAAGGCCGTDEEYIRELADILNW